MRTRCLIDPVSGPGLALNAALFQLGWFACVISAAHANAWMGVACVVAIVAWHMFNARRPGAEAQLMIATLLIGTLWELLMRQTHWIEYPDCRWLPGLPPYWLLALWMLFATTINSSLAWMKARPWIAALFGAIGGPLAFVGGARLGAARLVSPAAALAALAIGWAILTPLLLLIAERLSPTTAPCRHGQPESTT